MFTPGPSVAFYHVFSRLIIMLIRYDEDVALISNLWYPIDYHD